MKYLRLHNLLVAIILFAWLIFEMFICGLCYVLYVIWNFKLPHDFWLELHSGRSDWDDELIADKNPLKTFVRRYNLIFKELLNNE